MDDLKFQEMLEDLDPNESIKEYELPKCIVSVDLNHNLSLIKILNPDKITSFWKTDEFIEDWVGEEEWNDYEAGIYKVTFDINSWQDNTPDSSDWNTELVCRDIEPINIPLSYCSCCGAPRYNNDKIVHTSECLFKE